MLVIRKVAAHQAGVTTAMITYWAKKGYIKKHYVLGNHVNYLVDLDEVLAQYELGIQRKSICYNKNVSTQPRDAKGNWIKTKQK